MKALHEDRGSMPLAMLAVIVVGSLMMVVTNAAMGSQRSTRFDRNHFEVLHVADAGVQRALYLLSSGELDKDDLNAASSPPRTATFSEIIDGRPYEWYAEQLSGREWRATSTGTQNGVRRTVVAALEERAQFFPGAFGDELVALNGTSSRVDSYNSSTCTSPADVCRWGTDPAFGTGRGAIGSNENVDVSGNTKAKNILLYDWLANPPHPSEPATATDPGGSRCEGDSAGSPCVTPGVVRTIDRKLDYGSPSEMQFMLDKLASCGTSLPSLIVRPSDPPLAPKDTSQPHLDARDPANPNFYCYENLDFTKSTGGTATIRLHPSAYADANADGRADHPVIIYVRNRLSINSPDINVACFNTATDPSSTASCTGNDFGDGNITDNPVRPKADALQIFVASDTVSGGADVFMKTGANFAGTVYAPRARCGGSATVHVYGSLICGTIDNVGNWQFHYDDALGRYGTGLFDLASWTEGMNP